MTPKEIVARFRTLESDRKVAEETWESIEKFIYPLGGGKFFQDLNNEGEMEWRRRDVYDDTAIQGADTLAASIHGSLTSPSIKWFDLKFDDPKLNDNLEARKWLEECGVITWSTIQQSNFNLEMPEGYLDLTSFGNTVITEMPVDDLSWKGVVFDAIPLREAYFEEDQFGQVRALYRKLSWKPSQFIAKFGKNTPENIQKRAEKADSTKIDLVFCIQPVDANKDADTTSILKVDKRPYGTSYVLLDNAEQIGESGGVYEMPAYAVRWRRAPGSQWGYGPGHLSLPTVVTLNELIKLTLEAGEKIIDPPSLVRKRSTFSDLVMTPGGHTIVDDIDKSIKPYESAARFDVSNIQINDLRMMINRIFHVDQLELKESPAMSATEVMVRYELMNRLLGPTMGRLQTDLLDPIVNNTFRMLFRAKKLPTMPDVVKQAGGLMTVDYVGPLSRAQKSDEVASVERWLAMVAELSQIYPDLRHVPNVREIAKYMANGLNIPAKLMNTEAKITAEVSKDKRLQNEAIANEQRGQAAEVANLEQNAG